MKRRNLDTESDTHRKDDVKRHREKMATTKPRNARGYQKLGERPGTDSPSQLSEGTNPTNTFILDS